MMTLHVLHRTSPQSDKHGPQQLYTSAMTPIFPVITFLCPMDTPIHPLLYWGQLNYTHVYTHGRKT